MRIRRVFTIAAVVLSAGSLFAACGDDNKDTDSAADTTTTAGAADQTTAPSGNTITVVAKDISFDQTTLTAKAGEPVTFTITNEGKIEHNLTIEKLKVDKDVEKDESASQTVTPTAGTYEYFCHYHPDAMKGTLTVS